MSPHSLRSGDSSTYKIQFTLFLNFESHYFAPRIIHPTNFSAPIVTVRLYAFTIPLRFASGIIPLTLRAALRSLTIPRRYEYGIVTIPLRPCQSRQVVDWRDNSTNKYSFTSFVIFEFHYFASGIVRLTFQTSSHLVGTRFQLGSLEHASSQYGDKKPNSQKPGNGKSQHSYKGNTIDKRRRVVREKISGPDDKCRDDDRK